ncbi:MAG TPA: potassium-transporting ATPase subunit KdpA, partial [Verrucomicrobiota bacterium]|nr:potassium-transporting ATPase subunit KdpA [Verrucomicrobiota bacterium]
MDPTGAFNAAVSFTTNTNWQWFSGEVSISHLTQMLGFAVHNFTSAAVGLAIAIALIRGITRSGARNLGNFWVDLTRGIVRILLPLALVATVVLISQGVVQNFHGHTVATTIDATNKDADGNAVTTQSIPGGPVASQEAIKELGTNGGGFYNANSSHPFESPNGFTNFMEIYMLLLIPLSLVVTFGLLVRDKRQSRLLIAVMAGILVVFAGFAALAEQNGSSKLSSLQVDQSLSTTQSGGNMEGKEVRFGATSCGVFAAATTPQQAVDIANLFTTQAVAYTRELQARQAEKLAKDYLRKQVEMMDRDISDLEARFRAVPGSGNVTSRLAQVSGHIDALNQTLAVEQSPLMTARMVQQLDEALIKLQGELRELNARYTELHPDVQRKMAEIEAVQSQRKSYSTNLAALSATGVSTLAMGADGRAIDPMVEIIGAKLNSLEYVRIDMLNRQREAELYAQDPPGMARIHAPATLKTVSPNHRELKIGIVSVFGGFLGMLCALSLVLLTEAVDSRLKSADDLKRVARLPVLSTLGDLNEMHEEAQTQWAFRTWTMLQGRLSRSQNHGLVCGITSSTEGEGRSTWISLLAEAASLSGFRVLTIATQPSATPADSSEQLAEGSVDPPETMNAVENNHALTSNVLAFPARVTEQLTGPNSQPVVHIPMPGWVWNLERRKQWRAALNHWCKIDNLVIFVELPPACIPEAVLLGSNLPNLLWLADSGTADAEETRIQLQTLRDARCNLVGAVLNREQGRSLRSRFPRWIGCAALVLALGAAGGRAQETAPLPIEPPPGEPAAPLAATADARTNRFFSITGPEQRADWQKHLTLGAGDILTFALYGEPLLTRTEVVIAPDG